MTTLTPTPQRLNRAVTLGEALGAKNEQALEFNTAEAAVCGRCGKEPRLYHHVSPTGRDMIVWIPVEHTCPGRRSA